MPLGASDMQHIRSREIAIVFQEPMTSLNPVYTVGDQIAEVIRLHEGLGRREATDRAIELLRLVHVPAPQRRVHEYPHQLSGGMRQRVMIAMAPTCSPGIADRRRADHRARRHHPGTDPRPLGRDEVEARHCDHAYHPRDGRRRYVAQRVAVMYAGRIVEEASVGELFAHPLHASTPRASSARSRGSTSQAAASAGWRRSAAPCRACSTRRPAAASRRAAASTNA